MIGTATRTPPRECGTCTLCCKVLGIVELEKPAGRWCALCKPGRGCTAYETRPASCRSFTCGWLADPSLPDALRPDRSKVVLSLAADGSRVMAECDPGAPMAWRQAPIYGLLKNLARDAWARGTMVTVRVGERLWVLTPARDLDLGVVDPAARLSVAQTPGGVDVRVASGG